MKERKKTYFPKKRFHLTNIIFPAQLHLLEDQYPLSRIRSQGWKDVFKGEREDIM